MKSDIGVSNRINPGTRRRARAHARANAGAIKVIDMSALANRARNPVVSEGTPTANAERITRPMTP